MVLFGMMETSFMLHKIKKESNFSNSSFQRYEQALRELLLFVKNPIQTIGIQEKSTMPQQIVFLKVLRKILGEVLPQVKNSCQL